MIKKISLLCSAICLLAFLSPSVFAVNADDVLGAWQNEKATQITIYKCVEKFCGKYIKIPDPERIDKKNKDASKKGRKVMGADHIYDLEYDSDGEFEDGKIYDPDKGKAYDCNIYLKGPDELYIEGCLSFLCGGTTWTRVK